MYSSEHIKNYVYINKISNAKLLITETDKNEIIDKNEISDKNEIIDKIDILPMLIPFVGPNYNFYKDVEDIGVKLNLDKILIYLKYKNEILLDKVDLVDKNYKLLFNDNFGNEYNIQSNQLTWNPELKL